MNRLIPSLAGASVVLAGLAVFCFLHGGAVAIICGVIPAVIAIGLWLAIFGLMYDPEARSSVEARLAEVRGENLSPVESSPAPAAPVQVDAEATQGFTVARRPAPQDRRAKKSSGR